MRRDPKGTRLLSCVLPVLRLVLSAIFRLAPRARMATLAGALVGRDGGLTVSGELDELLDDGGGDAVAGPVGVGAAGEDGVDHLAVAVDDWATGVSVVILDADTGYVAFHET